MRDWSHTASCNLTWSSPPKGDQTSSFLIGGNTGRQEALTLLSWLAQCHGWSKYPLHSKWHFIIYLKCITFVNNLSVINNGNSLLLPPNESVSEINCWNYNNPTWFYLSHQIFRSHLFCQMSYKSIIEGIYIHLLIYTFINLFIKYFEASSRLQEYSQNVSAHIESHWPLVEWIM